MIDTIKEIPIKGIPFTVEFFIVLFVTFGMSLIFTPLMTFVSRRIGAVDKPNKRRVNTKIMPSAGGLAIFASFAIATLFILPMIVYPQLPLMSPKQLAEGIKPHFVTYINYIAPFIVAGGIVVLTGLIDDIKEISPKMKMAGLLLAASITWFFTHARFDNLKIPFGGPFLEFPAWLSFIFTVFWIVSITNAMA